MRRTSAPRKRTTSGLRGACEGNPGTNAADGEGTETLQFGRFPRRDVQPVRGSQLADLNEADLNEVALGRLSHGVNR